MKTTVTEVFNTGTEAYYRVTYDFGPLLKQWAKDCKHTVVIREENLVGEGAMEYVQWYDCKCAACGKTWTENA